MYYGVPLSACPKKISAPARTSFKAEDFSASKMLPAKKNDTVIRSTIPIIGGIILLMALLGGRKRKRKKTIFNK